MKNTAKIVAAFALFFLAAPYLLNAVLTLVTPHRVLVLSPAAVHGKVTGSYVNRQHHLLYLDGDTETYYDFNAFVPDSASPDTRGLSQDEVTRLVLGAHLQIGDFISKEAHSNQLSVRRGASITRWVCLPPEDK